VIFENLGSTEGASIAVLGLAFKPDTDDVRETPAVPIIQLLTGAGARVVAHDPVVQALPNELDEVPGVELVANLEDAIAGVDAIVIVTSWEQYEELPALFERNGHEPTVVDGRRMLEKTAVSRYQGIGLGPTG
jgi:UDPglucose 6-dehydrogenase/GDP-mannose 6-dehydrogenase